MKFFFAVIVFVLANETSFRQDSASASREAGIEKFLIERKICNRVKKQCETCYFPVHSYRIN